MIELIVTQVSANSMTEITTDRNVVQISRDPSEGSTVFHVNYIAIVFCLFVSLFVFPLVLTRFHCTCLYLYLLISIGSKTLLKVIPAHYENNTFM